MYSLDEVRAWKCPDPTKRAVVVIFCARATNRENEVLFIIHVSTCVSKIGISSPCAIFDHDGPFRRRGTLPGYHLIYRAHTLRSR